jgi:hypothetical protein
MSDRRHRFPRWTALALVLTAAVGAGSWSALRTTTDEPSAAADVFLRALVDERWADAHARLCPADRARFDVDEFTHAVSQLTAGLEGHDAFTLDPAGATRRVHYTLDYGDRTDEFDLDVDRVDGEWLVCRFLE